MKSVVDYDEMFPNRFLKSGLFAEKPISLTIKSVDTDELPADDGTMKTKGIITFEETDKQLTLNRTNGETIKCMFGRKAVDWVGKRVTFASEIVKVKGQSVDGIRIVGSPDIEYAFVAEFDITKKIGDKIRIEHNKRPLGISDPNNHGDFKWIVEPPSVNDKNRYPRPAETNEVK